MATYRLPDGKTVSDDMAFTWDGIQYPSNWIKLSTQEDRDRIGLEGPLAPPPWYDERFYWGYDEDGKLIPKDHAGLVAMYCGYVRANANAILRDTDWTIIREADNGKPAEPALKQWREDIRLATGVKIDAIEATADTPELAAYITGTEYPVWPSDPYTPAVLPAADGVEFSGDSVTAGF
jgi:hypothetical protein